MSDRRLTILGCGSALPTRLHTPSGQLLELCQKQFLIDCGEGVQLTLRKDAIRIARLDNIFISHLHGDHCFGLIGLISSLGMMQRTRDLHIYAQPDLERLLTPWLNYFCADLPFTVLIHTFNPRKNEVIYDDRSLSVSTIPLKHRVPCCGFLFEEKPHERHIRREVIEQYRIPLCALPAIKQGEGYHVADGTWLSNEQLTTPPSPSYRYAYCSDTAYSEKIIPMVEGVDCLFHEATYLSDMADRAKETLHSTAQQAATIARKANVKRLIIGHYSARYDDVSPFLSEARTVFENTEAATEHQIYEL